MISLVGIDHRVAPDSYIALSVDGGAEFRFQAGSGWRSMAATNDHYLLSGSLLRRLLYGC